MLSTCRVTFQGARALASCDDGHPPDIDDVCHVMKLYQGAAQLINHVTGDHKTAHQALSAHATLMSTTSVFYTKGIHALNDVLLALFGHDHTVMQATLVALSQSGLERINHDTAFKNTVLAIPAGAWDHWHAGLHVWSVLIGAPDLMKADSTHASTPTMWYCYVMCFCLCVGAVYA